ncbi:MAG: hypothetical protein R3E31_08235 [Chloroflexota bacterium]
MNMKLSSLILTVGLMALIVGCTSNSGVTDPEPVATQSLPNTGGALSTVAPEAQEAEMETAVPPTYTPVPTPLADDSSNAVATGEAVSPATVDLSKVTPLPTIQPDPEELPQPGIPGQGDTILLRVQQDLATRLGKNVNDIVTVSMEEIDWPDSSLGCPAGDFAYMSVITPGYQIILSLDGAEYDYHTSGRGAFVLCVDGRPAEE